MSYHSALSGVSDGSGTAVDPFGGIGGATESDLAKLVAGGLTFKDPPNPKDKFQTGIANREKYIYVVGSDKMFYKFKYPNSGIGNTPSDSATQSWFNNVVSKNSPKSKATSLTKTPKGATTTTSLKTIPVTSLPGLTNRPKTNITMPTLQPVGPSTNTGSGVGYIVPVAAGVAALAIIARIVNKRKSTAMRDEVVGW